VLLNHAFSEPADMPVFLVLGFINPVLLGAGYCSKYLSICVLQQPAFAEHETL
jgi:hypothetical protein